LFNEFSSHSDPSLPYEAWHKSSAIGCEAAIDNATKRGVPAALSVAFRRIAEPKQQLGAQIERPEDFFSGHRATFA
jgi:hypothetical protein